MKFYYVVTGAPMPWAHNSGQFYVLEDAPPGSYPITQEQYDAIRYHIADGDTVSWYADQRPYTTAAWSQPVFTSATASDGSVISAGNYQGQYGENPYHAMDGYTSGGQDSQRWWGTTTTPTWWKVIFSYRISITRLVHYNREGSSYANIQGRYWADEAMTIPIGAAISTANTGWLAVTVYNNVADPIVTDRIYFQKTGGAQYSGIGEVVLTARKFTYEVPQ
jgi:hypothetical protein